MILVALAVATLHRQALKLPSLFSDNMVFQRGVSVPFYGSSNPSETITVTLNGQTASTKAGPDGKWLLRLQPLSAGGPFTATVQSDTSLVTLKDVEVGEVWVCSGQSNMEFVESGADDYAQAQDEANPSLRMFTVGQASTEEPASDVRGAWIPATKHSIGAFSAVALAFGRELQNNLNVPVGLIVSSWGGTKAESWTSRDALSSNDSLKIVMDLYREELKSFPAKYEQFKSDLKEWIASRADSGNEGFLKGWENRKIDTSTWKSVYLPGTIEKLEPSEDGASFDGAAWFRTSFIVPSKWTGQALVAELGPIADYDDAYVNGTKIGMTKATNQEGSKLPRTYRIAPGILLDGENTLAIRVYAAQGACGFTGLADQMKIRPANSDSDESIPLAGTWLAKVEKKVDTSLQAPHLPIGPGNPKAPGGLFNGMIAPLMPYAMKGVIWYQGESNADQSSLYNILFPTLIRDWRQKWNQGQFPFYFVQLPNFHDRVSEPGESDWASLREAQSNALKLTNTGMATILDLGEAATIHPKKKREVGQRLAAIALSKNYGVHKVWAGPMFHYMVTNNDSLRVYFQHTEDRLKTTDGKAPVGFAIAGSDQRFYWATARIEGISVVLSCPEVPNPIAVRYAWADNPEINLVNSAGLPTAPFRTDNWRSAKSQQ